MSSVVLDLADLETSLAAAQTALLASPAGSRHVWRLPTAGAPAIPLAGPVTVGDPARSLTLAADPGAPRLVIDAGAQAAALDLVGVDLELRGVTVEVVGRDVTGVSLRAAGRATVTGCRISAAGRTVNALALAGGALAEVTDTVVHDVRATVGEATGVSLAAPATRLHRVSVQGVDARTTATGIRGEALLGPQAEPSLTLSQATVDDVAGGSARGVVVRAGGILAADPAAAGPDRAALTLLDVTVRRVRARRPDGAAQGIEGASAGLVDARGLSAEAVEGAAAGGIALLVGGALQLSGATVTAVVGGEGGAVGVAVRASASRLDLTVDDVHAEQVHATGHAQAVRGIDVSAPVSEAAPWFDDDSDPGAVWLTGCVLRRISGIAVAIDADLRDVALRGLEVYNAAAAGTLRGERVTVTETTCHRLQAGLAVGPCSLTLHNSLITGVAAGPALAISGETDILAMQATFALPALPAPLLEALPGGELPYVDAGPDGVPAALAEGRFVPAVDVDLRLAGAAGTALHGRAMPTSDDIPGRAVHVGAHPPLLAAPCEARDPLAMPAPPPAPPPQAGPVIDRLAKDGRGLLRVMQQRASLALPEWVPDDAADLTTTLLELLAHRLDRASHAQDAALAEAYLPSARLRRSVEEHARLVDYHPDPGLSASTMLQVRIDPASYGPLGLRAGESAQIRPFLVGADTVVVNPDGTEEPVIVSTEDDLVWQASLADVRLAEDIAAGATHAVLRGDLLDLQPGRWLVLMPADARAPSHVVRATMVAIGTDQTVVRWDPRRPAPRRYLAGDPADPADPGEEVLANVVPAHHDLRLTPGTLSSVIDPDLRAQVDAVRPLLDVMVQPEEDGTAEVVLPLAPVSRVAPGWPFPGAPPRTGEADVRLAVDDEPWRLVPDVAGEPGEVFAIAADPDGGSRVVLGQPGALPPRPVRVTIDARLGVGAVGNVGAFTMTSLLVLGPGSSPLPEGMDLEGLRAHLRFDNPVPGVGGRDPEPLDRIRLHAPWAARTPVTAVTAADYVTLLQDLPEVAAARARVSELGERRLVRTTVLLRDEDTLVAATATERGDVDPVRDAERLRRWTLARRRLEEIRLLGFDVELVPPAFVPLDVDVVVDAQPWAAAEQVRVEVTAALSGDGGLFDPDTLGLGGDVHVDALLRRVLAVTGVQSARVTRLRRLHPDATEHAVDGTLPVAEEEVAIITRPYGDGIDGLLTVEVCGGVR